MQTTPSSNQKARAADSSRRGEVNLHDFLMLTFVVLGGFLAALYAGEHFGWIGFLLGLVIGPLVCLGVFGVLYLALISYAFIYCLIFVGMPYLPTCRNGKCKSGLLPDDDGDYERETDDRNRTLIRCKCGLLYWRNHEEGRLLEVLSDGSTKPYMVWKPFRGWRPDDSPSV